MIRVIGNKRLPLVVYKEVLGIPKRSCTELGTGRVSEGYHHVCLSEWRHRAKHVNQRASIEWL